MSMPDSSPDSSPNSPADSSQKTSENDASEELVALLTLHQADIHAFINSLLPGDPNVEDVLQRTNMVLWKKQANFEVGTSFKAWAFSVARWETRAWLTEKKRNDWLVFNDDLTDQLVDQFQQSFAGKEESNIINALRRCLGKLENNERFLIFNYYQGGKSMAECAAITRKTEGALRVSLFRIRAGLRRCIEAQSRTTNPSGMEVSS